VGVFELSCGTIECGTGRRGWGGCDSEWIEQPIEHDAGGELQREHGVVDCGWGTREQCREWIDERDFGWEQCGTEPPRGGEPGESSGEEWIGDDSLGDDQLIEREGIERVDAEWDGDGCDIGMDTIEPDTWDELRHSIIGWA